MIQVVKSNGTTNGGPTIQIIDKYGNPKTPFVPIVWGTITGTLSAQTDLQDALNLKEDKINKGLPNGYASLNGAGLVPSSQLPSYVDDIVEVANYAALPMPGETGKIYVTLDTNEVYRWSGSVYIEIAANPAVWGTITGTVTAQTDLTSYISSNYYPLVTNPAGYITSAALAPYLTSATAASTYYPLTNPNGYISGITSGMVTTALGFTPYDAANPAGYITSSALTPYLLSSTAASTYYPLTNPSGYITASALTPYLTTASAALTYYPIPTGTTSQYIRGDGSVASFPTIPSVTPSALTKTDDTNVTLTLGGSPSTALLAATSITVGWTGTLADSRIASAATWNAKQDALSGTGFVKSTAGVISYDTNTYLTTADAASTYYPLTNPAGYITSSSLSGYVPYTGATANLNLGSYSLTTPTINGVASLLQFGSTDNINIGNAVSTGQRRVRIGQGTAVIDMGNATDAAGSGYIFFNQPTLSAANAALAGSQYATILNSSNQVFIRLGNGNQITVNITNHIHTPTAASNGAVTTFTFTKPNNTSQTASTSIAGWNYNGGSRTWLVGNITAQNENIWGAVTYNFGGASVIAKAIGNVFNAPIAGTNATITDNFAAQFNGRIELLSSISFNNGTDSMRISRNTGALGRLVFSRPGNEAVESVTFGGGNEEIYIRSGAGRITHSGPEFQIQNTTGSTGLGLYSNAGDLNLYGNSSTNALRVFGGTRNVTIQNGGTVTDNGYRLEVFGTTNVVGTTSTDGVVLGPEQAVTGTGANWTGTGYATGYTHTPGSVDPLVNSFIPGGGAYMQISYTVTGRTAGSINITFVTYVLNGFNTNSTVTSSFRANGSGPGFTITPTTDFNGTIVVSVKYVSTVIAPIATYKGSLLGVTNEIRSIPGTLNTIMGVNAGRYLTTGASNTIIGYNAMPNVMTGSSNVAIGTTAGVTNTAGTNNTYLGSGAGYLNAIGGNNVCLGTAAGYGSTGNNNIFIGLSAGNGSSGGPNTAIGTNALYTNTSGGNNNVIGFGSMQSNTTGSQNDAIGREAAFSNTTGSNNQFFGFRAGRYIADGATANAVTDNSIFIGVTSKALASGQTNQIVIGYNSTGIGSNTTVLGNSSTVTTAIYGNLMLGTTTASTYKLDVQGTANILTSLNLGNYATPTAQRIFTVGQDTAWTSVGSIIGSTSNAGIYMNVATPSATNYVLRSSGSNVYLNTPSASDSLILSTGAVANRFVITGTFGAASFNAFSLLGASNTGQTASTAVAGWNYQSFSRQWLTGNIGVQYENVWGATTYSFVGASTITTSFGNVFNPAIAGTNCTITNNFAALFNGNIQFGNQNWVINSSAVGGGTLSYNGGVGYFFTTGNIATDFRWQTAYTERLRLFGATGNMLIQNGGTFTDAGFRLDVQGTTRITGNTTIGSTGQLIEIKPTATAPTYTQTGSVSSISTIQAGTRSLTFASYAGDNNYISAVGAKLSISAPSNGVSFYIASSEKLNIASNFYLLDGYNVQTGTTTGTTFGTNTTNKLSFWNTTPIVQPANTTSLNGVLENTGLMASGSTISTINKPLVVGVNTTPRTGVATDGVTSVLGDLQNFTTNYHSGEVLYNEVSGEALNFGQLCWRDRFGKWQLALGNVAGESAYNMLGICLHTVGAADTAISILTRGYVETTYISATNTGSPLYMSAATAGSITDTFPAAAGNVVRLVGNVFWDAASQTNGKWILYFNPDSTWIEL